MTDHDNMPMCHETELPSFCITLHLNLLTKDHTVITLSFNLSTEVFKVKYRTNLLKGFNGFRTKRGLCVPCKYSLSEGHCGKHKILIY